MQHIHWLGTGLSSIPGIRRITQNYENVTIWNRTLEKAQQSILSKSMDPDSGISRGVELCFGRKQINYQAWTLRNFELLYRNRYTVIFQYTYRPFPFVVWL